MENNLKHSTPNRPRILDFRYQGDAGSPKLNRKMVVNHKNVHSRRKSGAKTGDKTGAKSGRSKAHYAGFEDLEPSLNQELVVVFVGFNPGLESSRLQHHYAHHTNLFWKLFNESRLLVKVLQANKEEERMLQKDIELDSFLCGVTNGNLNDLSNISTNVKANHDLQLVNYNIGFTDLCLRCTKSASELSMREKLENIPRLLEEFKYSKSKKIVIIGKGIWEVFIKYIQKQTGRQDRQEFKWGVQENLYTDWLYDQLQYGFVVHVLPSTSGLVTSLTYGEKLDLWNKI